MHQLQPVIEHYEDIQPQEHHKIWLQVNRIVTEYKRILRFPTVKICDKYVKEMRRIDLAITEKYFDDIKQKALDDTTHKNLLVDNEKLVADLKNKALTSLSNAITKLVSSGQDLSVKDSLLVLKALEQYGTAKSTGGKEESDKTKDFVRQLLGDYTSDSQGTKELQSIGQEASQLRLPNSSISHSN